MIRRVGEDYRVEGPVTLATVGNLLAQGLDRFEGARPRVDFSGVDAVESSALSLILEWTRRLRAQGRDIAFLNLGPSLTSLSHLYGIADLIPVAPE